MKCLGVLNLRPGSLQSCTGCSLHKGPLAKGASGGGNPVLVPLIKPSARGDLSAQRGDAFYLFSQRLHVSPAPALFPAPV